MAAPSVSLAQHCQNSWRRACQGALRLCSPPSGFPFHSEARVHAKSYVVWHDLPPPPPISLKHPAHFHPRAFALAARAVKKGSRPWGKRTKQNNHKQKMRAPQQSRTAKNISIGLSLSSFPDYRTRSSVTLSAPNLAAVHLCGSRSLQTSAFLQVAGILLFHQVSASVCPFPRGPLDRHV